MVNGGSGLELEEGRGFTVSNVLFNNLWLTILELFKIMDSEGATLYFVINIIHDVHHIFGTIKATQLNALQRYTWAVKFNCKCSTCSGLELVLHRSPALRV